MAGTIIRRVYPRACGGTARNIDPTRATGGLSPRVRGNPIRALENGGRYGSIPARAGEPATSEVDWQWDGVYPRACGGTTARRSGGGRKKGLSPRVRGNREQSAHRPAQPRSIPRVRGNRASYRHRHEPSGSIPARAGEPAWHPPSRCLPQVYPRACGGTPTSSAWWRSRPGLSPRVRGNRLRLRAAESIDRSIPARAGNRRKRIGDRFSRRSIPARAGEPR